MLFTEGEKSVKALGSCKRNEANEEHKAEVAPIKAGTESSFRKDPAETCYLRNCPHREVGFTITLAK
jgi:hypothetical protein